MDCESFVSDKGTSTWKVRRRQTTGVEIAETADKGENTHGLNDLCNQTVFYSKRRTVRPYPRLGDIINSRRDLYQVDGRELLAIQLLVFGLAPEC
jgi:hypothetical protein